MFSLLAMNDNRVLVKIYYFSTNVDSFSYGKKNFGLNWPIYFLQQVIKYNIHSPPASQYLPCFHDPFSDQIVNSF